MENEPQKFRQIAMKSYELTRQRLLNKHSGYIFQGKEQLSTLIEKAPDACGTYLWYGSASAVGNPEPLLYVGKARSLRKRLKSYLSGQQEPKTRALLRQAVKIDWILTDTEEEALLLEAYLVKTHQPKYNVRLKDDKKYPYLCLSLEEAYPQLRITREKKNQKNHYFGPYTNVRATRSLLAFIDKAFLLRKKRQKLPLSKKKSPCLNFHIGRCLAPCQGNVDLIEYQSIVKQVCLFLEGKHTPLMEKLEREMRTASQKQQYEKAAQTRNVLGSISKFQQARSVLHDEEEADLLALAVNPQVSATEDGQHNENENIAQIVVLQLRNGNIFNRLAFHLQGVQDQTSATIIFSFLRDYYLEHSPPAKIICPDFRMRNTKTLSASSPETDKAANKKNPTKKQETEHTGFTLLQQTLQKRWKKKIRFQKNLKNMGIYRLARKNAWNLLNEQKLAIYSRKQREQGLLQLQKILGVKHALAVIECFDISHSGGQATSASSVQFVDGLPQTAAYRRYRIRSVKEHQIDDFLAMHEVLSRRLRRLKLENLPIPNLLLIDGGAGQLSAATRALREAGFSAKELPVAALAKENEDLYYGKKVFHLPKDHAGLILLQHIRDEAHRFAIKYHQLRRHRLLLGRK